MLNNINVIDLDEVKIVSNINIKTLNINCIELFQSINNIDKSILNEINKLLHNIGMRDNLLGYNIYSY